MNQNSSPKLPPGQQLVAPGKWPIIGERQPAAIDAPWSLQCYGEISQPDTFSVSKLRNLPQTEIITDIHCVTRWSMLQVKFRGVLLADFLDVVRPTKQAKFISFVARSARKHSSSLPLDVAIAQRTLLALDVAGEPISTEHGGPIRNIVSGRYFYKSVKWLTEIELLASDRLGFWESESGYHNNADPWAEERYLAGSIDKRDAARLIASKDFSNQNLLSLSAANRELNQLRASQAALRNADFSHSSLLSADFQAANLSNANLRHADLRGAIFVDADLEGADLTAADLRGANFSGSSLIGASFFDPAIGPESGARFDDQTILPDEVIGPLFPQQLQFVREQLLYRPPGC